MYKKTTECKFKNVCFKNILKDGSVMEFIDRTFKNVNGTETWDVYDLINTNITSIDEMPPDLINKKKHQIQYDCYTLNKEYLDTELIRLAIDDIKYPIYHLDFESYNCPLPRYYRERPYMQSVFQFSDVTQSVKDNLVFIPFNRYESWARTVIVENQAVEDIVLTMSEKTNDIPMIDYIPLDGVEGIKSTINITKDVHKVITYFIISFI